MYRIAHVGQKFGQSFIPIGMVLVFLVNKILKGCHKLKTRNLPPISCDILGFTVFRAVQDAFVKKRRFFKAELAIVKVENRMRGKDSHVFVGTPGNGRKVYAGFPSYNIQLNPEAYR